MIIDFSVCNFRSFKGEQKLSFVAGNYSDLPENTIDPGLKGKFKDLRLLKGLAIYGPNGGGKSNLLYALHFLAEIVEHSANSDAGDPTGIHPFLLDSDTPSQPSEFTLRFVLAGIRYHFAIVLNSERILFESLSAFPKDREQVWYRRTWDEDHHKYEWEPERSEYYKLVNLRTDLTRENALYISTAAKLADEQLTPLYLWFKEWRELSESSAQAVLTTSLEITATRIAEGKDIDNAVLKMLQYADLGITSISVKKSPFNWKEYTDIKDRTYELLLKYGPKRTEILLTHRGANGSEYLIPWQLQSTGTQKLFSFSGPWFNIIEQGLFAIVDEIESSMHPAMVRELLKVFFHYKSKVKGAQVIFTTHNPLLLDLEVLRRDQIWFVDKDKEGASHLYPLTDYKPRNDESLIRGYLSGRYGAVPFIPHGLLGTENLHSEEELRAE